MKWKTIALFCIAITYGAACDELPGTPRYEARKAVLSDLIDPDSAKITFIAESETSVCGTVNARNRMGGYVGAQPFIYDETLKFATLYPDSPSLDNYRMWSSMQDGEGRTEEYNKIQQGCSFPADWKSKCNSDPDQVHATDDHFCTLWLKNDIGTLYQEAHRNDPY